MVVSLRMQVCVESYGCAANQGDAAMVEGLLTMHGHTLVENAKQADVVILMTCIVIDTTQQRMIHRLHSLQQDGKKIILGGCLPAALPELAKKIAPNSPQMTPRSIHHVIDLLEGRNPPVDQVNKAELPRTMGLTTTIPIADGCLQACSYCITRRARGTLTSYKQIGLISTAQQAINNNCRELRLTAQDSAAYGLDTGTSLASLVLSISAISGDFRIRLGMMHPHTVKQHLENVLAALSAPKVYRFIHLPLQSGSDAVLTAMCRNHTIQDFMEIVERIRAIIPNIGLATDVIVGFPGETDEQFNQTCRMIEILKPDIVNITRFSARPYTSAKTLDNRIPTDIVKLRSSIMTEVVKQNILRRHQEYIGSITPVLILEQSNDGVKGKSDAYQPVYLPEGKVGEIVSVKVVGATLTHLVGKIID